MWKLLARKVVQCNCRPNFLGHAIVTGATSGIGRATAYELARRNWAVTLACRDSHLAELVQKAIAQETHNDAIYVQELDLTSRQSIDEFVGKVSTMNVHVLINNAGVMASSARPVSSFGGLNIDTVTNYVGPFYLTQSLLPHLLKSHDLSTCYPRVIFVASSLASKGYVDDILEPWHDEQQWNTTQAYSDSKLACCMYARELHHRLSSDPSRCAHIYTLFTGGMVNTGLSREVLSNYSALGRRFLMTLSRMLLKSPEDASHTVVHCAISPDVIHAHSSTSSGEAYDRSGSGLLYVNCAPVAWPSSAKDLSKAHKLFDDTLSFLNLNQT